MVISDQNDVNRWVQSAKVIVTDYFGIVRTEPLSKALPVTDAIPGILLRRGRTKGAWQEVFLPDGRRGHIERAMVEDYQKWRHSRRLSADNVEEASKLFLGVPYLWGGTSPKGFDCSGYTKTVFRLNGFELNRDANQQALMGEDVVTGSDLQGLKKGDLLFFGRKATDDRPERIWHVAIYLGKKEFIHCSGRVRLNSLDPTAPNFDENRLKTFVRAKRVIGIPSIQEVG